MKRFSIYFLCITLGLVLTSHMAFTQGDPQRENLGDGVNSVFIEILPVVSPDGKTLYFDRKYSPGNVGSIEDEDDIYYSTLQPDGTWSPAKNIGAPMNSKGSDVLFWLAPDGNTALMYSGHEVEGKAMGLALARKVNETWQKPEKITVKGLEKLGSYYYAYITPDRKRLLVAFSRNWNNPDNLDIYFCNALSTDLKEWGEPISLGNTINTASFEGAPFMASDNRTLYFISAKPGGYGKSDIYISRRTGDSWIIWSEPINLGSSINTPNFEASISIPADGQYLYLSGVGYLDDGSHGGSDLYRQLLPDSLKPSLTVLLNGSMLAMGKGVSGLVRIERISDGSEITSTVSDRQGKFTAVLQLGEKYNVIGWAQGYEEAKVPVSTVGIKGLDASVTLKLKGDGPKAPDTHPIMFATASSELSGTATRQLGKFYNSILPILKASREVGIEVIGHTDDNGEERDNQLLSEKRANAVKEWLVKKGIAADMINATGRGESDPVVKNTTERGRSRNRRVEIRVTTESEIWEPILRDEVKN